VVALTGLLVAGVVVEDWRIGYNTVRPHDAGGELTPADDATA
jgi:transposase InsO family protein